MLGFRKLFGCVLHELAEQLLMTSIEVSKLSDQIDDSDRLSQLSHGSSFPMGLSRQRCDSWPAFRVCKTYQYSLEVDHEDCHSGKNNA
jgi:hypothetical protein